MDFDFIDWSDKDLEHMEANGLAKLGERLARVRYALERDEQRLTELCLRREKLLDEVHKKVILLPDEIYYLLPSVFRMFDEERWEK